MGKLAKLEDAGVVDFKPIETQPQQLHHKVWPQTYQVFLNEPALLLIERDEMRPDSTGFNRYQTLFVWRDNGLAKYMEDLGPNELWIASPLDIPGGDPSLPYGEWLETVESLRDHANMFRQWLSRRIYQREVPDLILGLHDHIDQENLLRKHISSFGTKHQVTR